jgi:hypothetical protein
MPGSWARRVGVALADGVGVAIGCVAGAIGPLVATEVSGEGVDVGAVTPEQAAIANAATSVVASSRRICFT